MSGLQLLTYIALVVFFAGTTYKMIKISRMPLHLRWDLYPIPHERGKGSYGGSYFEESDWWTKPADTTLLGEIAEMAREIIFIKSMFYHNRSLWIFSFPFHLGLYLSVAFVALVYIGAGLTLAGYTVAADAPGILGSAVYHLTMYCGIIGAILAGFGSLGLIISRAVKHELRAASNWTDYFNLALLLAIFATTATLFFGGGDAGFDQARTFAAGIMTFSAPAGLSTLATIHYVLAAVFLLWLPLTHMTHFVGKYFTYHKVRWEDHPNVRGGKVEGAITKALDYKITWSAAHIKSGGTWAEAATDNHGGEGKNEN